VGEVGWHDARVSLTRQTLLYVFRGEPPGHEVLLGEKLQGFGAGMIMGLGGHVEDGETDAEAAVREAHEEAGVRVEVVDVSRRATVTYRFPAKPSLDAEVAVFIGEAWTGHVTASEELRPEWFPVAQVPLGRMWDDEQYWLPRVLGGELLVAEFVFDNSSTKVAQHTVARA
jgi:8-oxo-dGTP diphosphatase